MKKRFTLKNFAIVGVLVIAVLAMSCNKENDDYIPQDIDLKSGKAVKKTDLSIAEVAITNGFDSLVVALSYVDANIEPSPGLVNMFLTTKDQYTVFAPTNMAFENLVGEGQISDLPAELVLDVLLYHVTEGRRAANSVVPKTDNSREIETLLGSSFWVNMPDSEGDIKIMAVGSTANIIGANNSAFNGIVHAIDAVLLPIEL